MNKKSLGTRLLQAAAGLTLGTFAVAAQADPFTLQGSCSVTSVLAGQGQCQLSYQLSDASAGVPTIVRKALVRVNGTVVHQYVNDSANPSPYAQIYGVTMVACGASHTITALVAPVGGTYQPAGSLLPVACPTAP